MIISELSPIDLIKFTRDKFSLLGFDYLFISLCREADNPKYFDELSKHWSSIHDLTGENIVFLFFDSQKEFIRKNNFSWDNKYGFFYNYGLVLYSPSLKLLNKISYTARYDKYYYAKNEKNAFENTQRFSVRERLGETITLGITEFSGILGIQEDKLPCLYIESLKFSSKTTIPIQSIYAHNVSFYDYLKSLKSKHLDEISLKFKETYKTKNSLKKYKIIAVCKESFQKILRNSTTKTEQKEEQKNRFIVAFTFAGENRQFVEQVADEVSSRFGRQRVFYDAFYEAELARPNLDTYLQNIYHNQSDLLVVFLCENYSSKEWCSLEWRAIRDLIKQKNDDRIIFVKMGNFEVGGVFSIDGYLDGTKNSPQKIAQRIIERANM